MYVLWDGTYGFSFLSEKTRKSNCLQIKQHFLLSYLKTLGIGPAGVRTRDLPLSRPALSQLSVRSRHLELVGARKNGCPRGRHARGEEAPARKAHENRFNSHSMSADISNWSRGSWEKKWPRWARKLLINSTRTTWRRSYVTPGYYTTSSSHVSLSRARSFLPPLLPSACYAGYSQLR